MEPKCVECGEEPRCRESEWGRCWSCLRGLLIQPCYSLGHGDKAVLRRRGHGDRPLDYPPKEQQ